MESVLVPPLQMLLHPPLRFRWEGKGDWCSPTLAALKYAALITKQTTATQPGVVSAVRLHCHPRCARTLSTPSLQTLTGKRVVASLLGNSSLVALCSLAFSQEGQ